MVTILFFVSPASHKAGKFSGASAIAVDPAANVAVVNTMLINSRRERNVFFMSVPPRLILSIIAADHDLSAAVSMSIFFGQ